MKTPFISYFLCVIFVLSGHSTLLAQTPRLQLVEYFDNTSIPTYITFPNKQFDTLAAANTDKLIYIKYHVAWGSAVGNDPMNLQNPNQPQQRVQYYGINADPWGVQDGATSGQSNFFGIPVTMTQADINRRDSLPSPFYMEVYHTLNNMRDSIKCHVKIIKTDTASGDLRAQVVVIEKNIHFTVSPGICGDTNFANVVKMMLPSVNGTILPSMNVGDTFNVDVSWKLKNVYDTNQLAVVSFIQNNITHEIHQTAYSKPHILESIDDVFANNEIIVYPNPFSNIITVKLDNNKQVALSLFNNLGELVLKTTFEGKTKIALTNLSTGFYHIVIQTLDGALITRRTIIKD